MSAVLLAAVVVGSSAHAAVLPTGRPVAPAGRVTALQAFPTGAAVSPDGKSVLVVAGPPIQGGAPAGPSGGVALMVVDAAGGQVRQSLNVDDAFQGVLYDRAGTHAYVAGGAGNTVHVFTVASDGTLSQQADIPASDFVSGLALTRDAHALWLAEPTANAVERIDLTGHAKPLKLPAPSPDRLALSPDDHTLFASNWRGGCVTAIRTDTHKRACTRVGDHPTGVAAGRSALLAADSGDATLAVSGPGGGERARLLDLAQVGRGSDAPNDVVLAPDGRTAYVSLGGDDAVAVLRLAGAHAASLRSARRKAKVRHRRYCRIRDEHLLRRLHASRHVRQCRSHRRHGAGSRGGGAPGSSPGENGTGWRLAGLIPTGWYPTALALSPNGKTLHIVTARGLGHSTGATQPYAEPDPAAASPDGAYATVGTLETLKVPDTATLGRYTAEVRRYLRRRSPDGATGNPIVAGRSGPIKHVIYVTRENKTYDADLGDLHPGPGTSLAIFGQPVTPNLHALERGFVEAQSFYYQGFASTVGHMWEDAGAVSDLY
ncbi:MAG: hypothetical protein QOD53_1183, partial [Thermoleophilaceae bacterium]|nr:hypothetical protein [Thermoleophilaceae bacterium]